MSIVYFRYNLFIAELNILFSGSATRQHNFIHLVIVVALCRGFVAAYSLNSHGSCTMRDGITNGIGLPHNIRELSGDPQHHLEFRSSVMPILQRQENLQGPDLTRFCNFQCNRHLFGLAVFYADGKFVPWVSFLL